jgi:hypothetical protein
MFEDNLKFMPERQCADVRMCGCADVRICGCADMEGYSQLNMSI